MTTTPALPPAGQSRSLPRPPGSADAWWLAEWIPHAQPWMVVTEGAQEAQRLVEELRCLLPERDIHLLPDWETLPYDTFSPHQDLISERLATLWRLSQRQIDVVIVPVTTMLQRLAPVSYLAAHAFELSAKSRLDLNALKQQLVLAGYAHVPQVYAAGEYSVRGGIVDLFPMGSPVPYRLELFDDEIDTIRTFDVDTQRSIYPTREIRLLPAREYPLDDAGRTRFRQRFREVFEGDPSRSMLYKDMGQGATPSGLEYYLPLFFEAAGTLFDYVPPHTTVCLLGDTMAAATQFWQETQQRYRMLSGDKDRPLLPPGELFLSVDECFGHLKRHPRIVLQQQMDPQQAGGPVETRGQLAPDQAMPLPALQVERRADDPYGALRRFVAQHDGRIILVTESLGRRETLNNALREHGLRFSSSDKLTEALASPERLVLTIAPLHSGFVLQRSRLALVTEHELYAGVARQRSTRDAKRLASDNLLRDLSEIKVGDPVVHEQHGVGRYQGLVTLDLGDGPGEFLLLVYASEDKLYVPVSNLHVVSRYSGAAPEDAPLYRLGSGQWDKARRKAMQQVRDTAAELLNLYAQRAAREGHRFGVKAHDYEAFAESFGFEETPDQAAAIQAVIQDMTSGKPMDRLVCGDVGFGKTEVALRAAFIAAMDGKQVAVLCPTTLLAEQHHQNFSDRFAEWPIQLAELSRFRSAKEQSATLKALAEGQVDIVIGTHRLIQKDMKFKRLGLVIIDEEHRFGVRQKEQLKALRAEVDVLALTATPIPRTMAMSLEGLRDFSVIATAPNRRLAIKTFVRPLSDGIIREAVLRELRRGGQVFFLHNEVESIERMQERLASLLPEARIRIAHGQMRERELEHVMRDFTQQRFNLLLCTTIIETGIDIASANTIIINKADRFGLAQLHQLRGRVGRSHHQAYAYLLVDDEKTLTPQAEKRLEAIQLMEELGAGFYLAMHDLEIRGAGEVLGDSQSGQMQEVGFAMYVDLLNAAVKALQEGREPDMDAPLHATTDINLHSPALLPEAYCPDVHERLQLYKRLAHCDQDEQITALQQELIDRFGLLPDSATNLLDTHRLRLLSQTAGIIKIDASELAAVIQFQPKPPIDPLKIIQMIQTRRQVKLAGPDRLRIEQRMPEAGDRVRFLRQIIHELL